MTDQGVRRDRTLDGAAAPSDPARFGEWVSPCVPAMGRLATRLAPAADRDDIVQEALTRAWVKRQTVRSATRYATWLVVGDHSRSSQEGVAAISAPLAARGSSDSAGAI